MPRGRAPSRIRQREARNQGPGCHHHRGWHEIIWEIRLDRMRVIVDDEVRFDAQGDCSGIESAPSIGPCFGSAISIRELSITCG
jgi:hypothetical protein